MFAITGRPLTETFRYTLERISETSAVRKGIEKSGKQLVVY